MACETSLVSEVQPGLLLVNASDTPFPGYCLQGPAPRLLAWGGWGLLVSLLAGSGVAALAQSAPVAESRAAANAAGTTVNNQSNAQINTSSFYGFGPGINCPTPTLSVSGFGGGGSGSSAGASIGADVSSGNFGGILTYTMPIGGANAEICKEIGRAQVEALRSQVQRTSTEAAKTQADINLVTALKCVEILRVAVLSGPFAEVCRGVLPRGLVAIAPADAPSARPARLQRFDP